MSESFAGLYAAFLTPLDEHLQLNESVALDLLDYLLQSGMDGVYVAGTTGEGMRLPQETRKRLVELLKPHLPKGKRLFVHVGAANLTDALDLSEHAAMHGADAVSSLPPQGDSKQVQAYYRELASKSPLPVILYYFPRAAPNAFATPEDLIAVSNLPNVIGVKFTDFNLYLMQRLVRNGKLVFNGYDEMLAAGLLMGAQGGIGSTYNLQPKNYSRLYQAAQGRDWSEAARLQSEMNVVMDVLMERPFFPSVRAVMKYKGFDCGPMLNGETLDPQNGQDKIIASLKEKATRELLSSLLER